MIDIDLGLNPFLTITTEELDSNIAEATRRLESAKDKQKEVQVMIRNFPETMKSQREKLNISMSKLSKVTHINKSTLYKYERGETSPNGVRLLRLCTILQIDYKML
ncbi:MAG: helix-turn-helix domain-containing protein [Ruminococcus sp.]|nr:helix-turn-helix domain-containing protein [Ruminococcus sp.]